MAVPETSPPVRVVHNSMQMLAQTVVKVDGIHRAVVGRFRHPNTSDVLLAKETSLVLASANDEGSLTTHHTQPLHATILNLQVLRAQQQTTASQVALHPQHCCYAMEQQSSCITYANKNAFCSVNEWGCNAGSRQVGHADNLW